MSTGIFFRFASGAVFIAVTLLNCESGFAQESFASLLQSETWPPVLSTNETDSMLDSLNGIGAWPPRSRDADAIGQSVLPVAFMQQSQVQQGGGGAGGQSGSNSGGTGGEGGAGAAAATDPSVPLAAFQLQNIFTPESYDASGYANILIVQPVIPLKICEDAFFPYHIIRPTLPVIAPTADPDGPRGVHGGLGDLAVLDIYLHPIKELKSTIGIGYALTAPTRTHPALGRGEWEIGPSIAAITQAVPKWNIGFLYEQFFSVESDAYSILFQPVIVRTLPDEWYVGWGDLLMKLDDQDGGYNLPISGRVGKVVKCGDTPVNIFVQPSYTPRGLRSGPGGDIWSIKLSMSLLFPGTDLKAPILNRLHHR